MKWEVQRGNCALCGEEKKGYLFIYLFVYLFISNERKRKN